MSDFNPVQTVTNITDASVVMKDLSDFWSRTDTTKNGLKNFVADNKVFFEKASLAMGALSVGFSFAEAFGLFGENADALVMKQLKAMDKKLDDIKASMDKQFKALSVQLDYVVANAMLKAPEANILQEMNKARFYMEQIEEGNRLDAKDTLKMTTQDKTRHEEAKKRNQLFKTAAKNNLLQHNHDLSVDIRMFYSAFTDSIESGNILKSTLNYFAGAPGPLINRGYNIMYLVMEAVKVIGLKQRLLLEEKYSQFNIKSCVEYVDYEYNKLYKPMIDEMQICLGKIITSAIDDTEATLKNCFDVKVKPLLKNDQQNTKIICDNMSSYYPYLHFAAIEFGPCSEDNKVIYESGLRASRAFTFYELKETDSNFHIWWQWRLEIPKVTENRLTDTAQREAARKSFEANLKLIAQLTIANEIQPLVNLKEYGNHEGGSKAPKVDHISTVMKQTLNTDLYYYSKNAHALLIRKKENKKFGFCCNDGGKDGSWVRFIHVNTKESYYYIFWMLLDAKSNLVYIEGW